MKDDAYTPMYREHLEPLYCDPQLNWCCKKDGCFINNGPCRMTTDILCAISKTEQEAMYRQQLKEWEQNNGNC